MARPDSGFRSLLCVRFLTVVNDNLLRWLAIGLGKYAAGAAGTALVLTIGTAGFVLPFVALAWLAGWLADRYPKPRVIAWCKFAEVVIVAFAAVVLWGNAHAGGSFAGWSRLTPAAVALVAVAAAGWLASLLMPARPAADPASPAPWNAVSRTWADLAELARTRELAVAAAGIVFFWALGAVAQLNVDQYVSEGGGVSQGQAVPLLLALVIGIGVGSVVAGRLTVRSTDLGFVPVGAAIMAAASLGLAWGPATILGPDAAAWGWWFAVGMLVLLGLGAGMFDVPLEAFFQALSPPARRGSLLAALNLLTFAGMLGASLLYGLLRSPTNEPAAGLPLGIWLLLGTVILIGCQAAIMAPAIVGSIVETVPAGSIANANGIFALVTLVATLVGMAAGNWLADQPPPAVAAAVVPLVSARGVFGIFAALSAAAAAVTVCCAPRASLRMFVATIVHAIWRYRVRGLEQVPAAGPVVVVANHLSWLDGFLLPMSCPRPLRMVVYGPNIKGRFLRMLADQWRFILFDPRPKSIGEALKTIQSGLAAGDAVGIFCEGGISRTGQLLGFKRGLEWLLERVEAPIMPASIDGMWGSLLSFSEGRYFTKRPRGWRRPLTLTFGRPLPVGTHPNEARLALQELSATAVSRRLDPAAATAEAFDGCCLLRRDDRLLASLAAGDPLHDSLGTQSGRLLGIAAHVVEASTSAVALVETLRATEATIWLARIDQVAAVAAVPAAAGLGQQVAVVVMPIATAAELTAARAAAAAFQAACGVEPVVAYAPREVGGLVAMNSPSARHAVAFEVTSKPETVGRVVNGVVVWPRAAMRIPLDRESLATRGIPDAAAATLVISATAAGGGVGRTPAGGGVPGAALLADAFDVDAEGFLVPRA